MPERYTADYIHCPRNDDSWWVVIDNVTVSPDDYPRVIADFGNDEAAAREWAAQMNEDEAKEQA